MIGRQNERDELLKAETGTRKALHATYVTTYGLKYNAYANNVPSQVTLDSLFV